MPLKLITTINTNERQEGNIIILWFDVINS